MDDALKQRLVGAAVVVSLGIIFIPMLLDGGRHTDFEKIRIEIPESPDDHFSSSIKPLEIPRMMVEPAPDEAPIPAIKGEPDLPPPVVDTELEKILKPAQGSESPVVSEPVTKTSDQKAPSPVQVTRPGIATVAPAIDTKTDKKPEPSEATRVESVSALVKPAIKSTQSGGPKAWVVQVGSFESRENAIKLQNKLRKQGFPGFVESFMKDGELSHRVRIGPEIYRADAEKILSQLKDKTSLNGIVVGYP